jgi:CBS domain-containing protein
MKARDIMTRHPSVVTPSDTLDRAAQLMKDRHIGMLPVVDDLLGRHLQGILTDRDIVTRCVATGHDPASLVRDHMTSHDLGWVAMDDDVTEVVTKMNQHHIRRIPVLADGGRLAGVIALADLATRLEPGMERRRPDAGIARKVSPKSRTESAKTSPQS